MSNQEENSVETRKSNEDNHQTEETKKSHKKIPDIADSHLHFIICFLYWQTVLYFGPLFQLPYDIQHLIKDTWNKEDFEDDEERKGYKETHTNDWRKLVYRTFIHLLFWTFFWDLRYNIQ